MKILLPVLFFPLLSFAQSKAEEALILNQEMQFLEEAAKEIRTTPELSQRENRSRSAEETSLERTYFSDAEKDEIRVRAAAPKRARSF